MAEFKIRSFQWFKGTSGKGTESDKVWGFVVIDDKYYAFWGRRGSDDTKKNLRFQEYKGYGAEYDLEDKAREKTRKGYSPITCRVTDDTYEAIEAVYPGFVKSFKKQLVLAKLSDNIMDRA